MSLSSWLYLKNKFQENWIWAVIRLWFNNEYKCMLLIRHGRCMSWSPPETLPMMPPWRETWREPCQSTWKRLVHADVFPAKIMEWLFWEVPQWIFTDDWLKFDYPLSIIHIKLSASVLPFFLCHVSLSIFPFTVLVLFSLQVYSIALVFILVILGECGSQ